MRSGDPAARQVLVIGDSHAEQFAPRYAHGFDRQPGRGLARHRGRLPANPRRGIAQQGSGVRPLGEGRLSLRRDRRLRAGRDPFDLAALPRTCAGRPARHRLPPGWRRLRPRGLARQARRLRHRRVPDIPALGPDANPADWIDAFLTNADWGVQGFPSAAIGDFDTARNYWRATGMMISLALCSQVAANSHLKTLMEALNCDFRQSGSVFEHRSLRRRGCDGKRLHLHSEHDAGL